MGKEGLGLREVNKRSLKAKRLANDFSLSLFTGFLLLQALKSLDFPSVSLGESKQVFESFFFLQRSVLPKKTREREWNSWTNNNNNITPLL
jgi:hypothetical protein